MTIRPMCETDLARALALTRAAQWNQVEADWLYFLQHGTCVVGVIENEVVGTCAILDREGPVAWIAMMLVDPAFRRQAIGAALFEDVLNLTSAASAGLDATPLGRPLYEKFGFRESDEIERWLRPASPLTPPSGPEAAPWREGHHANQLGPLNAATPDDAITKAHSAISQCPNRPWIVDVPTQTPQAWRDWLKQIGFEPQRPLSRMYRGTPQPIPANLYATSGPEYGPNRTHANFGL